MLVLAASLAFAAACSGGDGAPSTPTAPALDPSPTVALTSEPLASPDADGERVLAHVQKLAGEIGPRTAGTLSERMARDYIKSALESYGYTVTLQEVAFDASAFLPARVDIGATALGSVALRGSADGVASGRLTVAGLGRPEEFPPGGIPGGIALIQRGELTFAEKVANAHAAGAAAVIIYNNEDGRFLGETDDSTILVVAMNKRDGEDLVARVAVGAVEAKVSVTPPKATGYNVVARPGPAKTCETLSGGHYDSVPVTGGADDNASGTAAVLELARVAKASKLAGAHCFVLFSAEEFGLFGSREFVREMTGAESAALEAMLNFDVVGVKEPLALIGAPDLVEQARLQAQQLGIEARTGELPPGAASDHVSFDEAGIPVVMFNRDDALIHTQQDDVSRMDIQSLEDVVRIGLAMLKELEGR